MFFYNHKVHLINGLHNPAKNKILRTLTSMSHIFVSTNHQVHLIDGLHKPRQGMKWNNNPDKPGVADQWITTTWSSNKMMNWNNSGRPKNIYGIPYPPDIINQTNFNEYSCDIWCSVIKHLVKRTRTHIGPPEPSHPSTIQVHLVLPHHLTTRLWFGLLSMYFFCKS